MHKLLIPLIVFSNLNTVLAQNEGCVWYPYPGRYLINKTAKKTNLHIELVSYKGRIVVYRVEFFESILDLNCWERETIQFQIKSHDLQLFGSIEQETIPILY